jgi:hypothetical protein
MSTKLITIDRELLSNTCGGDFADDYVNNLKKDAKDWWKRAKAAGKDVSHGNIAGALGNSLGGELDVMKGIGDAVVPISAIAGAKA